MGNFLEQILKPENRKILRIFGIILLIVPVIFFLGDEYGKQPINPDNCYILTTCWFRGLFLGIMIIMACFGFILTATGFSKRIK